MVGSQTKYASRTGTPKYLFESHLQKWLWRQHYGGDPFAKTLPSISLTYMFVDRTTVCNVCDVIATSWSEETKYTASTHGTELEEGNQEEKTPKDTMKVSNNLFHFSFHL